MTLVLLLTFKDIHFPVSRGKSKASAFFPPLREKEQWRKREELDISLETLPTGMA